MVKKDKEVVISEDATPVSYEEAITTVGFGRYNVMLILTLVPSAFATVFSTSAMSYVFPIAQCDLNLTLDDKGMLNSITYFGMLSSGFLFGFLTDTLGRKKLIVYVFLIDGFFVVLCALSQNFHYLTIVKFFEGFIENGAFAAVLAYTSEFHSAKYRPFIPLFYGAFVNTGGLVLPMLSWLIFTDKINISIFNILVLRSWNILILVTAIPSLVAGFIFMLLPESPKFLMTIGDNEQALKIFIRMYKWNNRKLKTDYPITTLIEEEKLQKDDKQDDVTFKKSRLQIVKNGFKQIASVFYPPYGLNLLLVVTIQFAFLMGNNTFRLWLPQLFTVINDKSNIGSNRSFDLCYTVETLASNETSSNRTCSVVYDNNGSVYIDNVICSAVPIVLLLISIPLVRIFGKKIVLYISAIVSGLCLFIIPYSGNHIAATISLSSLCVGLNYIAYNSLLSSVVDLFPTTLRAMAVASAMVFGRLGSSLGNLIFPSLVEAGCLYPFFVLGGVTIGGAFLSALLPNSEMNALK